MEQLEISNSEIDADANGRGQSDSAVFEEVNAT
jgi:hypothetical protein